MIFHMSDAMWKEFELRFKQDHKKVFKIKEYQGDGHAVVINGMNLNEGYWKCKNSWGGDWAD